MNMSQFLAFVRGYAYVKGVGLKGKEPISDIDRIFLRSVRQTFSKETPLPGGNGGGEATGVSELLARVIDADAYDSVSDAAVPGDASAARDSKWRKAKTAVATSAAIGRTAQKKAGNAMHQHQFVAALIRLAATKGSPGMWLSQRLDMICKESIAPHVYEDLKLVNDAFSEFMGERRMVAVLRKHCKVLTGVFDFYADTDTDWDARFTKSTMNISELTGLCEDVEMFNQRFAIRNMVSAFVRVNIDDELYEQEDEENSFSELIYDEFVELLARLYELRDWPQDREAGTDALEDGFDMWLTEFFLPAAGRAIKKRRKSKA